MEEQVKERGKWRGDEEVSEGEWEMVERMEK